MQCNDNLYKVHMVRCVLVMDVHTVHGMRQDFEPLSVVLSHVVLSIDMQ